MKKFLHTVVLTILFLPLYAQEYSEVESVPNPTLSIENRGWVSNPDGILSRETELRLNTIIDSMCAINQVEIAVVALKSIGNNDVWDFAIRLGRYWGVGKSEFNNGIVMLFVLDRRELRFATGQGVEGIMPDAISTRIFNKKMKPFFKNGEYDKGIIAGIEEVAYIVGSEKYEKKPTNWNDILLKALGVVIIFTTITLLLMQKAVAKIRKNSNNSSNIERYLKLKNTKKGIFTGIFAIILITGFVAGMFGLAKMIFLPLLTPIINLPSIVYSRRALKKFRYEDVVCNECGGSMHYVSEEEEDKYLSLSQQFEEELHAVDYDVFRCNKCINEKVFTLEKSGPYSTCPVCHTKAMRLVSKKTVIAPTYIYAGKQIETSKCKYCNHEERHNKTLPKLTSTPFVGGGGSFSSGRGGFSGGGSSFGGGSFGGGGGGGRW